MRILTVADLNPYKLGGYEKFMVRLAERCQREDVTAHFLVVGEVHADLAQDLERAGALVHHYYGAPTFPPKDLARLFRELNHQYRFDVVAFHFCTEEAGLMTLLQHRFMPFRHRSRYVWHQHSEQQPPASFLAKKFSKLRILSLLLDGICPLYEKARQTMLQRAIPARKLKVLSNGVERLSYTPQQVAAKRQELSIGADDFLLFAAASLIKRKNVDMMILALDQARRVHPYLKLAVAGEGNEKTNLEKLISELGLVDHVMLLGGRSDVRQLIASADLCLLTSYSEALPYVCLEAFAQGKTVIATPAGGVPEIVLHGTNGLIVPFDDVGALAKEIVGLVFNSKRKANLEEHAYETYQKRFSIDVMIDNYYHYYVGLINGVPQRTF